MLTAYLDESGQESAGNMFIAGHVGDDEQWRLFADKWRLALGQRKHLHMHDLRWNNPHTRALLDRLGVIPTQCGLTRVLGGVKASDYTDLIRCERDARALMGYYFSLTALVTNLARWVPDNERLELVLEDQQRYRDVAKLIVSHVARYAYGEPRESAVVGGPACGSEVGKLTEGKAVQSRKYRSQILLY